MVLQSGSAGSQLARMEEDEQPACKKVRLGGGQQEEERKSGRENEEGSEDNSPPPPELSSQLQSLQRGLLAQCLCGTPLEQLQVPLQVARRLAFHCRDPAGVHPPPQQRELLMQLLACLQLLCETASRQASRGSVCCHLAELAHALVHDHFCLVDLLLDLLAHPDPFVCFAASRAFAALIILARAQLDCSWLTRLLQEALSSPLAWRLSPALEVLRVVVEWKEWSPHPLEEGGVDGGDGGGAGEGEGPQECCQTVSGYWEGSGGSSGSTESGGDPMEVKCLCIRALEGSWGELVGRFQDLLLGTNAPPSPEQEAAGVAFLGLWEAIVSVRANLSVADTKPFHARLEAFVPLLTSRLGPVLWKRLLDLFGEVLCYGSTLALQDVLADEACNLAHLLIRSVKDRRLLDQVPYYSGGNSGGFGGTGSLEEEERGDRPLLQKVVLLVLKSVAVTVKETRCESSSDTSHSSSGGSSSGSDEADMAVIERSIREVLRQLDAFVKGLLPFHPDAPLSEWMVRLFSDQDDALVEAMVCALDTYIGLAGRMRCPPQQQTQLQTQLQRALSPVMTFLQFLGSVSHDPHVLLDLLVSNETCFLLYLLRFLKFVRRYWEEFVACCGRGLDDTMSVLIRLRIAVDRLVAKSLFPYNINPVLKLLQKCEDMYEVKEN